MSDQDLNDLLKAFDNPHHCYPQRLVDAIRLLVKERDEVRRMWCEAEAVGNCLSVDDMKRRARTEAKRREWDCYKEDGK